MKKRTAWLLIASVVVVALGAAATGAAILLVRLRFDRGVSGSAAGRYLQIGVQGALYDGPPADLDGFLERRPLSLQQLIDGIDRAAADSKIKGIIMRVGPISESGWGAVRELRDAVSRFRESGKPAYAHVEYCNDKEYYLASACSKVFAVPEAIINVTGLAMETTFFRRTLDKIGVEAQFEGVGKYKNAPNTYTESSYTEPHREQMEALLDGLFENYIAGLSESLELDEDQIRELLNGGPYIGGDALKVGLIDELVYLEELKERLQDASSLSPRRYLKSRRKLDWGRKRLALIYVVGDIMPGKSGASLLGGIVFSGSDTIAAAIRQARQNENIKAIVLRIDSPGGVATAADVIWREVREARRVKPVVASMGDLAASGGYYVAMGADAIVAQPTTLTGSIGVFGGKLNLRGLYDKLGVTKETLKRGRFADLYSDYRPWTDPERERIRGLLVALYRSFLEKAAEGRGQSVSQIGEAAQGRVWTGSEALDIGLVDQLGGLNTAVAIAKEKANIPAAEEVTLVILPERKGWIETLFEQDDEKAMALHYAPDELKAFLNLVERGGSGNLLARLPYEIRVH
ncbi:MAG: signal peptide peptidase SppA [Vicinamibacteria bacterium]|nr:signal peptide peptidase SppA [Vicinamibacteria bacterium]